MRFGKNYTERKALDHDDGSYRDLKVAVEQNPEAFIFKSRSYSGVKAKVCADCGFIAFYADNPYLLWQTYQNRLNKI
jgi:hypothetical protein